MVTILRNERGLSMVAMAVFLFAFLGIMGIAVEIARLTDTATEVQTSADSAALGAATALGQKLTNAQVITAGQNAGAANQADGRMVDALNGVTIVIGNYDPSANANPHFSPNCNPNGANANCNATKATVTVSNVRYLAASMLTHQASTTVVKEAVGVGLCQGSAFPFPLAVCKQVFNPIPQGQTCGTPHAPFQMLPSGSGGGGSGTGQNACWSSLNPSVSANDAYIRSIFPAQCGGTTAIPEVFQSESIPLNNGTMTNAWKQLACCIQCKGIVDYTVSLIDCPNPLAVNCNQSAPVVGFATIRFANAAAVDPTGSGNINCGTFFAGCSNMNNGPQQAIMTAQQDCNADRPGRPGGTNCFGNTVTPILGQLP